MSKQKQDKPRPEVEEMKRLLDDATKESPELWATIKQSVRIAELTTNSIQADATKGTSIYSGAETINPNQVKEL